MDVEAPLAALLGEIEHVRLRSAADLSAKDETAVPLMLEVAGRAYPALADKGVARLISRLLTDAVGRASGRDLRAEDAAALSVELGLTGATQRSGPGDRNAAAAAMAGSGSRGRRGYSASNHRRPGKRESRFRAVADAVEEIEQSVATPTSDVRLGRRDRPWIERPGPRRRFRALLQERRGVVVLAGPPGVGKRTLAERLTADHRARDEVVLRLSAATTIGLQHSMITELARVGVAPGQFTATPELALAAYLTSSRPPRYVLVEDAPDGALARFLADAATADTVVVVTSGRRLDGVPAEHHMEIGELEPDEACDLVRQIVPDTSQEDAARLAGAVEHHVGALVVACGMIASDASGTVAEFCRGLRPDLTPLLDAAPGHRPALVGLYRELLAELAREAPVALTALEQMVVMHETPIHTAFVVAGLDQALGLSGANDQHLRAIARSALLTLRDRFLVAVEDGQFLTVPGFTRAIVADLVRDRATEIGESARSAIGHIVGLDRSRRPDVPLMEFLLGHSSTVLHLMSTMADPHRSDGLVTHVSRYTDALACFLQSVGEPPWRVAVVVFQDTPESFTVQLVPVPATVDDAEAWELVVPLGGPGGAEVATRVHGWRGNERMLIMIVGRKEWISDEELRS